MIKNTNRLLKIIELYDKKIYDNLMSMWLAIEMCDDIIDKQVNPEKALELFNCLSLCFLSMPEDLKQKIEQPLLETITAEFLNLNFIPCKNDNKDELEVLKSRANMHKVFFEYLCYVDKSFDTEENRNWLLQNMQNNLIANDCEDILSGRFEDLINKKRNYVILNNFSQDIYYNWRDRKEEILEAAQKEYQNNLYIEPVDKRLNIKEG